MMVYHITVYIPYMHLTFRRLRDRVIRELIPVQELNYWQRFQQLCLLVAILATLWCYGGIDSKIFDEKNWYHFWFPTSFYVWYKNCMLFKKNFVYVIHVFAFYDLFKVLKETMLELRFSLGFWVCIVL